MGFEMKNQKWVIRNISVENTCLLINKNFRGIIKDPGLKSILLFLSSRADYDKGGAERNLEF